MIVFLFLVLALLPTLVLAGWTDGTAYPAWEMNDVPSACQQHLDDVHGAGTYVFTSSSYVSDTQRYCNALYPGNGVTYNHVVSVYWLQQCPEGYQVSGDPASGYFCEIIPITCDADQLVSSGYYPLGTDPNNLLPPLTCSGGCEVLLTGSSSANFSTVIEGVTNYYTGYAEYNTTGETCTAGDSLSQPLTSPDDIPPFSCGPDQYQGEVNGENVCIDKTTGETVDPSPEVEPEPTVESSTTTVTENPDGSVTTTTITIYSNGDTVTIVTTTYPDGSSESETTTQPGSGGSGGSGGTVESNYCATHPNSPICTSGKASGGADCSKAPTCTGDAVLCAVLHQQWLSRCSSDYETELTNGLNDLMTQEGDAVTDEAGVLTSIHKDNIDMSSSMDSLFAASGGRSSTCPSPRSINLSFTSKDFDYGPMCDAAVQFGNLIYLIGLFLSGALVIRGFTEG